METMDTLVGTLSESIKMDELFFKFCFKINCHLKSEQKMFNLFFRFLQFLGHTLRGVERV